MPRIAPTLQQLGIAPRAAAVLGRAGPITVDAPWQRTLYGLDRQFVLDPDHVVPTIAKVVLVYARRPLARSDLIQADLAVSIGPGSNSSSGSAKRI
jgi:hypothetical protein